MWNWWQTGLGCLFYTHPIPLQYHLHLKSYESLLVVSSKLHLYHEIFLIANIRITHSLKVPYYIRNELLPPCCFRRPVGASSNLLPTAGTTAMGNPVKLFQMIVPQTRNQPRLIQEEYLGYRRPQQEKFPRFKGQIVAQQ